MSSKHSVPSLGMDSPALFSELLLLADGTVLVHNLTPLLAELLSELGFKDDSITIRVAAETKTPRLVKNSAGQSGSRFCRMNAAFRDRSNATLRDRLERRIHAAAKDSVLRPKSNLARISKPNITSSGHECSD